MVGPLAAARPELPRPARRSSVLGMRQLSRDCAVLVCALLVAWSSAAPGEVAPPRGLIVVRGPLPADAAATLSRAMAYHGEFGGFALGRAAAGETAELRRLGYDVVALGAWPSAKPANSPW